MPAPSNTTQPQTEDIDLLLLAERIIIFFRKYRWLFIISLIIGIGIGLFFYKKLPRVYKSRMILHSNIVSNSDYIEIVSNWDDLRRNHEYATLAGIFNCSEEVAGSLKEIKGTDIQKVFTANNPNGFYITVFVSNNAVLEDLQKGILIGFDNTEYLHQKLEIKRTNLQELIDKTTIELGKIDSAKKLFENILEGKGRSSSSMIVDGTNINKQWIDLNAMLLGYKEEMKFTHAVQVLQGFSRFNNPAGPHLLVWLAIGIIFSLSLAWVIAFISSIRARLKKRFGVPGHS